MTTQNLFEYATRNKLRFPTIKGDLTVEQLWDLPLQSIRDDFNLDTVAKTVNKALQAASEESFVKTATKTAESTRYEIALEVVKHVIATKIAEVEVAATRAAKRQERDQLLAILAEKQVGEMSELSVKELQKRIKALED
jgi:hypothetical protein